MYAPSRVLLNYMYMYMTPIAETPHIEKRSCPKFGRTKTMHVYFVCNSCFFEYLLNLVYSKWFLVHKLHHNHAQRIKLDYMYSRATVEQGQSHYAIQNTSATGNFVILKTHVRTHTYALTNFCSIPPKLVKKLLRAIQLWNIKTADIRMPHPRIPRGDSARYSYVRGSGTGVVPGQHNNLIAIFR